MHYRIDISSISGTQAALMYLYSRVTEENKSERENEKRTNERMSFSDTFNFSIYFSLYY